jgi:hypothetical protein
MLSKWDYRRELTNGRRARTSSFTILTRAVRANSSGRRNTSIEEVARGVRRKVVEAGSERTGGGWSSAVGGRSGVAAGDAFARAAGALA